MDRTGTHLQAIRSRVRGPSDPGAIVLVVSGGDDAYVELGSQPCWHFPQGRDGGWAGYDVVDGRAACRHLESQRTRGARYFVLPRASFSWRHRFPELFTHLEATYRRVHEDEHALIYDLAGKATGPCSTRFRPRGCSCSAPTRPNGQVRRRPCAAELGASRRLRVEQRWRSDAEVPFGAGSLDDVDADFVVFVRDDAILPSHFLDDLIAMQVTLAADRIQPTHHSGPAAGPPITERHRGTIAREVDE